MYSCEGVPSPRLFFIAVIYNTTGQRSKANQLLFTAPWSQGMATLLWEAKTLEKASFRSGLLIKQAKAPQDVCLAPWSPHSPRFGVALMCYCQDAFRPWQFFSAKFSRLIFLQGEICRAIAALSTAITYKMLEYQLWVREEDGPWSILIIFANTISYKRCQICQEINLLIFSVLGCICKVNKVNSTPEVSLTEEEWAL